MTPTLHRFAPAFTLPVFLTMEMTARLGALWADHVATTLRDSRDSAEETAETSHETVADAVEVQKTLAPVETAKIEAVTPPETSVKAAPAPEAAAPAEKTAPKPAGQAAKPAQTAPAEKTASKPAEQAAKPAETAPAAASKPSAA